MSIYDWDGTTTTLCNEFFEWDGSTSLRLKEIYDYDGTTTTQVYSLTENITDLNNYEEKSE